MGKEEKALLRLWREKRGEEAPPDLVERPCRPARSGHRGPQSALVRAQLGPSGIGRPAPYVHRTIPWMAATLDGLVKETGAVFEAKFMLPWSFSEEAAAEKHMAHLQHNMLVAGTRKSVLSIITGGGNWIELSVEADPIYDHPDRCREGLLAGGQNRRNPGLVRLRTAETADRGGSNGRHERLQFLGGLPACFAKPDKRMPTTSGPKASSGL